MCIRDRGTKYVTVSNTWAIKDLVTSYFTNYTLCTVVLRELLSDFSNSLQIDKVTKVGVAQPVFQVGPPWMDGLTSFANISSMFPHISSCRLVASDREVGHLNDLPNLRQLEVVNNCRSQLS